jgi:nucleotide-binding universal stress UspA family protein
MSQKRVRSVVVGVDFNCCGDDAILESVKMIAEGWATALHAVHVLDPSNVIDHPSMPAMFTEERVLEQAPGIMRERIQKLARGAGLTLPASTLKVHARIGKPAEVLSQVAADYDADLIVVGTHQRQGLDRLLLGSVSELLVRSASCPVLVARPKDHSKRPVTERPAPAYRPGEEPAPAAGLVDRPLHISTEPSSESPTGYRIV